MLKDLVKLSNRLDSLGLTKEADFLDSCIKKIAGDRDSYYNPGDARTMEALLSGSPDDTASHMALMEGRSDIEENRNFGDEGMSPEVSDKQMEKEERRAASLQRRLAIAAQSMPVYDLNVNALNDFLDNGKRSRSSMLFEQALSGLSHLKLNRDELYYLVDRIQEIQDGEIDEDIL
jgi:hypothetical protein